MLSDADQERFSRHLLLDGWEGAGQEKLCATRAEVSGEGLAARWARRYLAASGVQLGGGRVLRVDGDDPAEGARVALRFVCEVLGA